MKDFKHVSILCATQAVAMAVTAAIVLGFSSNYHIILLDLRQQAQASAPPDPTCDTSHCQCPEAVCPAGPIGGLGQCPAGHRDLGGDLMLRRPGAAEVTYPLAFHMQSFSAEECKWLSENIDKSYTASRPPTEKENDAYFNANVRVADSWGISRKDKRFQWAHQRVLDAANRLNDQHWHYPIPRAAASPNIDDLMMAGYNGSAAGHYSWHQDIGVKGFRAKRVLAGVVLLSDPSEYEGGVLQVQGRKGEIIDMPQTPGTLVVLPGWVRHRVTPVTGGYRRSLVVQIGVR